MYSKTIDVIETFCDECESFSLTARKSAHNDQIIEFYCQHCKADWVEYV